MTVAPLWTVADCRPSNVDKKSVDGQSPVRLCNYTDVYKNHYIDSDMELMAATAPADQIERFQVRPGDVLITKDSETNEDIGVPALVRSAEPGMVCGYHLTLLRPDPDRLDSAYLFWLLESRPVKDFWRTSSFGVTRFSLVSPTVWRLPVPLLPLDEQRRLAVFLDRETAEIDAMNAELNHLIQTLRERRHTAMLEHLSSGITAPIGTMTDVTLGKMLQTGSRNPEDVLRPYMRAAHVQPDGVLALEVEAKEMWFSQAEAATLTLRAGDAVVVEGGVGGFGRAAYVAEDIEGWGFQNSIIRLRGEAPVMGRYLAHALVAARNDGQIALECSTSTMPHFTAEKVGRFRVPWHHPDKLPNLVDAIDRETARIDDMIADANQLKALLAERRSTLITEVVTGRKKVPA